MTIDPGQTASELATRFSELLLKKRIQRLEDIFIKTFNGLIRKE